MKLTKTQLQSGQLGGLLGRHLEPLLKTGLPLIENVLKPLTKSVSIPLRVTAAASSNRRSCSWENVGIWFYNLNSF